MIDSFSTKQIFIGYYGTRYNKDGSTFICGTHPLYPFLKIPEFPTLKHSAIKLLWAIELASSILQDLPTRKQTIDICKLSAPLFFNGSERAGKAHIKGYWRDLYRLGYINQYRRRYGPGSRKHFDVVYKLSPSGEYLLKLARNNQQVAGYRG